jgi:hypothetical protein
MHIYFLYYRANEVLAQMTLPPSLLRSSPHTNTNKNGLEREGVVQSSMGAFVSYT